MAERLLGGSSMGDPVDSFYIVQQRIGDENMEIPWAQLKP